MKPAEGLKDGRYPRGAKKLGLILAVVFLASNLWVFKLFTRPKLTHIPIHASQTLAKCASLNAKPGPPASFHERSESDRYQPGTRPVLLRNAKIWTGRVDGLEVVEGDILLDRGLIKAVGDVDSSLLAKDIATVDVKGAWVSPGIVDVHSHLGVGSSPALSGAEDSNSLNGLVLPWLRSVDGLNTHDDGYALAVAGGVTTSLILPGSADAIGGQAFVIKLRPTKERSTSSLLLEPPFGLNGSDIHPDLPPRWRHMKHACGENPAGAYSGTRMDTVWAVRQAYDKARQIKDSQDSYCSQALAGEWTGLGMFPEELQWESLVDILRGKVKVQTHCYEALDIDRFISMSNEFKFPVAAFHHAHEAYLVPEVLKKGYERPPAIAMFATFSGYKRESYRHSVYAPKILADEGIRVVMKSDHSGIVSRYLLHEAQQAHYHGLAENLALASVTTVPAEVLGLDHRIGFVEAGYDADIVVWDSHPLALGATPKQVYIDGIPQFKYPVVSTKAPSLQKAPTVPNFEKESQTALEHDGLPPLQPRLSIPGTIVFRNVSSVWERDGWKIVQASNQGNNVVVKAGEIACRGDCASIIAESPRPLEVDLRGGSISPALVSFGSQLGLQDIPMEESTTDGAVADPLSVKIPGVLEGSIINAADGLQFATRDALLAYRSGVSTSITPPTTYGFLSGLSVHFSLASKHKLDKGAVLQDVVAIHVSIKHDGAPASISTRIATLRRLLLEPVEGELETYFKRAAQGSITLVVTANSADVIATLLQLKREVESQTKKTLKLTLVGAAEAHLLAEEIGDAGVGVILLPARSYPYTWEQKRILPGPPLSESAISVLLSKNVTVGIGPQGVQSDPAMSAWAVRNLRFDAGWIALDSQGTISKAEALAMASSNIQKLLGVEKESANSDLVATWGGDLLSFEAKVVGVLSKRRGKVDLF